LGIVLVAAVEDLLGMDGSLVPAGLGRQHVSPAV
jgi:hypothetical protein